MSNIEEVKYNPCSIEAGQLIPCISLNKIVDNKAVKTLVIENGGQESLKGIFIKSGEYKRIGIVLNFCPFCGKPIKAV